MSTAVDTLYETIEKYIRSFLELNPDVGTALGFHQYDSSVPVVSRETLRQLTELTKRTLEKLSSIDPKELPYSAQVDYRAFKMFLEDCLFWLVDFPCYRMVPALYIEKACAMLFRLLTIPYLPTEHRLIALEKRIRNLDKVLLGALELIDEPYTLWTDIALEMCSALPLLLSSAEKLAREHGYDISAPCSRALNTIERFRRWLLDEVKPRAKPGFKPMGYELFRKLLRIRGISEEPEVLVKLGEEEIARLRTELEKIASSRGISVEKLVEEVKSRYVRERSKLLDTYSRAISEAREFVLRHKIVDLPAGERVRVIETPEYLRPIIPFAAYIPPPLFSYVREGLYLVTPPESEDLMKEHSWYSILNTSVHEAYPGHHTQFAWIQATPNIIRKFIAIASNVATSFIEGWAHYCEELLLEHGFHSEPEYRTVVLVDALWRAARVVIDVKLSTGSMSFDEAVDMLMRVAFMSREGAIREVKRYTIDQGYQLCYMYGKYRIKRLREKVRKLLGSRFREDVFHRLLLEEGVLPVSLLEEVVMKKVEELARGMSP
ncbi:MAG: hypothetical protein DRJ40_07895 [Thermoprotei archaeon]|nr:MAG: hypothetical protein DRJ40_07895 [Thermoprotei archaeon]